MTDLEIIKEMLERAGIRYYESTPTPGAILPEMIQIQIDSLECSSLTGWVFDPVDGSLNKIWAEE